MENINLTEMMRIRAEAKRESLRQNGQTLKGELLRLVELIDSGEWEAFEVRRGEIKTSGEVKICVDNIRSDMQRRENILHYAKLQLGGVSA